MYIRIGQHCDPTAAVPVLARQASKRVDGRKPSSGLAIALYLTGGLVEALGLGLIAAYGSVLAGGAIAGFGLLVGTIGNSHWPGQGVSNVALFMGYVDVARRWRWVTNRKKTSWPVVTAGFGNKPGRR